MTINVVTGSAGHVGANLVRALLARGKRVRALVHRNQRALQGLDVEIVTGDVRDGDSLRRAFAGAETVYHTAGYVTISMDEWDRCEAVNVIGTGNVVDACSACGVSRLVHFSSVDARVDEPVNVPMDESRPLVDDPRVPPYARSKAAGERLVKQALERGLDGVILAPTAILGPYDHGPGLPNQGLLSLCRGEYKVIVDGSFDWIDVRDIATAALRAAETAPFGSCYILGGHRASLRQMADLVGEILNVPVPRVVAPMWLARLGAPPVAWAASLMHRRPLYTAAALRPIYGFQFISHDLAVRELDHRPRPLRDTIEDTVRWFESAGLLPDRPARAAH